MASLPVAIAFDTDGRMYGVNTTGPGAADAGTFWQINPRTAEVVLLTDSFTNLGTGGNDIGGAVHALANAGPGHFYAAVNGGGTAADRGHLYEWFWNGTTLSGYDRGPYVPDVTDPVSAALFGNNTDLVALGDLWYWNDVLYGTLRADDSLHNSESRFLLASIDPSTAAATALANLDAWSDGTVLVGGVRQPKYVPGDHPTGQQFEAMVNYGSNVGLLRNDGFLFYWDGTTGLDRLLGQNIVWTGIDVGCAGIVGATAVPVGRR